MRCPADAVLTRHDLVVGGTATTTRQLESVTNLDTLDGLDSHQCSGQLCVQAAIPMSVRTQTGRQAPDGDLNYSTEGVSVFLGTLYFSDHLSAGGTVEATNRVLIDAGKVHSCRNHSSRRPSRTELNNRTEQADTQRLLQKRVRDPTQRHPCRRLPSTCSLQHRP